MQGSPSGSSQRRVIFRAPPDFDETANIFVEVLLGAGLRLRLLHDYPDFKPQVGWRVEREQLHEIRAVKDGVFVCEELSLRAQAEVDEE